MRTVFRGRNSIKAVSYEEHMISEDKYASRFSHQMEATVFILPAKYFSTLMNSLAFFYLRYLLFCVLWYGGDITVLYSDFFRRTKRHFTIHGLV